MSILMALHLLFMKRNLIVGICCMFCVVSQLFAQSSILYDHGHYGLNFSNLENIKWQFDREYKLVVNTLEDIAILRNIAIETSSGSGETLMNAQVSIYTQDGDTLSFNQDSFTVQPFDAQWTENLLVVNELRVYDTVCVKYSIQSDLSTDIQRWTVQHMYPVKESKISFLVPEIFEYEDFISNRSQLVSEIATDSTLRLDRGRIPLKGLTLTFRDIPAYALEPLAPAETVQRTSYFFAVTQFSLGSEDAYMPPWTIQASDLIVSDWFGKQYRTRGNYRWLLAEASPLFDIKYEDRLFILKLYEFVHQTLQWDGSYGLFPSHTLPEMAGARTVNKSSMNIAMMALLNAAQYKAYPVLVTTTDQTPVITDIPNINQFDHFVIMVELGRERIYIDCGDPNLPIGWIDSGVRTTNAMFIKNYKFTWIPLPDFKSQSSSVLSIQVDNDFSASGTIDLTYQGYDAQTERNLLESDRNAFFWKSRAGAISPDVRIDSVRFENVQNLLEPLKERVYFHIDPSQDHEELIMNPVFYSYFSNSYLIDSFRMSPVHYPFEMQEESIVHLKMDESLDVQVPENAKLVLSGGGSEMLYQSSSEQNDMTQVRFSMKLLNHQYNEDMYPALKNYMSQVEQKINQPLVITKKTL